MPRLKTLSPKMAMGDSLPCLLPPVDERTADVGWVGGSRVGTPVRGGRLSREPGTIHTDTEGPVYGGTPGRVLSCASHTDV